MRDVHPITHRPLTDRMSRDTLVSRLERETRARLAAEKLLEDKSRELAASSHALTKTAEILEDQRRQLNIILDHTIAAIFLATSDLMLCRANRAAKELFHLDDESLLELTVPDLFESFVRGRRADEATIRDAIATLGEGLFEAVGRRRDGSTFPLEFGVTRMNHKNRNHTVWIFRDITDRKAEEARREALERELNHAQKMEALGTLASGVAHEINTPIQYVSDNVRFLKDATADLAGLLDLYASLASEAQAAGIGTHALASIRERVTEIDLEFLLEEIPLSVDQSLHGIGQVGSIVNAIKEFSHPGDDEKIDLDLNRAIETTLTVSRNQWKYVAEVALDLDPDLPCVPAAPGGINQALLNIIVNAADAISERRNGERGLICIATARRGRSVEVRIEDNGGGIPQDVADRIFDPFFTTKEVGKGTGQGLAICDSIIRQKHGGTIEFETRPGEGTTFVITLPMGTRTPETRT